MTTAATTTTAPKRTIHELDATNQSFGRLASKIANILIGKSKPSYLPHLDNGDEVRVVNVAKIKITGKKMDQKLYRRHSMYPGNMKEIVMKNVMSKEPQRVLKQAVNGMLPKNKHRAIYLKRLHLVN